VKNVGVGNAPRNGICAALFAREGYVAAPLTIEGAFGWARASGDIADMKVLLGGLREHWVFAKNTYKPYPRGIVLHSLVDGCLQLKREHALFPADIGSITVFGDASLMARGDRRSAKREMHGSASTTRWRRRCCGVNWVFKN
jgi:2-methylcitrate dehydratase PrpD